MIKKYLSVFLLFLSSSLVFGQTNLSYEKGTGVNGGVTASITFPELSTCQTAVSVVGGSGIWNGVVWSSGTFNVIVNGVTIGNYPEGTNVNLNAYLPITSLQLTSNAGTWHTIGGTVTLTSPAAFGAPTVANVTYAVGAATAPLTATLTGGATALKWYVSALGSGYSAIAPTPSSAAAGITTYWVSQANGTGCEGARTKIKVYVGTEENLYHDGTGVNGGTTAAVSLSNFSTCQTEVYVDGGSGVWDGVSWSNGSFNLSVNGTYVGNYPGGTQVDLTAYIPVTNVSLSSDAWTWHTVDGLVHVVSLASSTPDAPIVTNVYYGLNQSASPLTATLSAPGTTLKWYNSANGDGYSATAPTPSTAVIGTTSYWVAQADASGCESQRAIIVVTVANLGTNLDFDGIDDHVLVAAETINDLPAATIETWAYVNSFGMDNQVIFAKQSNFENTYVILMVLPNGQVYYKSKNGAGEIYSNTLLSAGQWYHIAVSFDGGNGAIYINGVLDVSVAGDFSIPNDVTITGAAFGTVYTNGGFFNGSLDEFRVWDTVLDEATIRRRMNCEVDYGSNNLIANYNFNAGLAGVPNVGITTLDDQTINAHNGTLVNFGLTTTTTNWIATSPVSTGVVIPLMPTGTQAITYCYNGIPNQLTANGTDLMWYTTAVGVGSSSAPTPSTTLVGTTSYWVASSNSNGCESERLEIQVTVLPLAEGTDIQQACGSYTWIDGIVYTASNNIATFMLTGGAFDGCDSLATLDLTITTIPTAVIINNGNATLTASGTGTYQWVDCNNANAPISGATNALFAPLVNGSYAVIVTANGCSATSSCATINTVSLNELVGTALISIVPNPGTDLVNIVCSNPIEKAIVYSVNGSLIDQYSSSTLNVQGYAPGVYFVHVITSTGKQVIRFVKQ